MGINVQKVINSRLGVGLALGLGRSVPPRLGYPLARFLADRIASRKRLKMNLSVCANQWVVSGEKLCGPELDHSVMSTFRNTARCLYDLYHNIDNAAALQAMISLDDKVEELFERYGRDGVAGNTPGQRAGAVVVGVHLCSFDLALQAVGLKGLSVHALSAEQPGGGYRWQNRMRRQSGVEIIPASTASLRQAIVRLKNGGSVLTGLDRPVAGSKYRPRFFNRPASLPAHHIFLALKASVPVYMFASFIDPRGTYRVTASGPINMRPFEDHTVEMVRNAEAVLEVAEDFIRQAPQQWSMFYPVWPEVLGEVEGLWQISNRMKE